MKTFNYESILSLLRMTGVTLLLSIIGLLGCSQQQSSTSDAPPPSKTQTIAPTMSKEYPAPKNGLASLEAKAKAAIKEYKLTELKEECLQLDVRYETMEGKNVIDVREKHNSTCGGDPDTSPRLFSLAIDQKTGAVWSDAKSLTGEFEKLK
ncbi:MAG: hypothetical protein HY080_15160 [Gammaproteobacteria bacterium]|nr:hypothetical protein [Gammaproteobacteria bacterium]